MHGQSHERGIMCDLVLAVSPAPNSLWHEAVAWEIFVA